LYIGRFVVLGKTINGEWYLGYRVSSRSFPNRRILAQTGKAVVLPTEDAPKSDNPYISYNCLRSHQTVTVVANGSHIDPIIDKVEIGYGLRDAMILSLFALDYEHDQYNTPRIAAGLDLATNQGYMGIVAEDKLLVQRVKVAPGEAFLIATYELTSPTKISLSGNSPEELCTALFTSEYEHPVAAVVTMPARSGGPIATHSAR